MSLTPRQFHSLLEIIQKHLQGKSFTTANESALAGAISLFLANNKLHQPSTNHEDTSEFRTLKRGDPGFPGNDMGM